MNKMHADVTLAFRLLLRSSIQFLVVAVAFWHQYSFSVQIAHGLILQRHALDITFRGTLVALCASLFAWQVAGANRHSHASWKIAILSGLLTAVLLSVYAACAIAYDGYTWRFLGATNVELFRETDRLIFILEIIPAASLLAGILSLLPI
jgi:hypothetical protein